MENFINLSYCSACTFSPCLHLPSVLLGMMCPLPSVHAFSASIFSSLFESSPIIIVSVWVSRPTVSSRGNCVFVRTKVSDCIVCVRVRLCTLLMLAARASMLLWIRGSHLKVCLELRQKHIFNQNDRARRLRWLRRCSISYIILLFSKWISRMGRMNWDGALRMRAAKWGNIFDSYLSICTKPSIVGWIETC